MPKVLGLSAMTNRERAKRVNDLARVRLLRRVRGLRRRAARRGLTLLLEILDFQEIFGEESMRLSLGEPMGCLKRFFEHANALGHVAELAAEIGVHAPEEPVVIVGVDEHDIKGPMPKKLDLLVTLTGLLGAYIWSIT